VDLYKRSPIHLHGAVLKQISACGLDLAGERGYYVYESSQSFRTPITFAFSVRTHESTRD
jgi:hypothetical protein